MSEYPWYEEVSATETLLQGDLIESCPVLTFKESTSLSSYDTREDLIQSLQKSAGIQILRAIVMTQACDIVQGKVRNIILCPIYNLDQWKSLWEEAEKRTGNSISKSNWDRHTSHLRQGRLWNLALLNSREKTKETDINITHQVVDFHEVFSLPLQFLSYWVQICGGNRLRLLPPYREHLSQAFARFFMRVGLPVDIQL